MRWLPFSILAYLVLGLQIGAAKSVQIGSAGNQPDFILIVVIFVILNASRDAALLGSFILGGLEDLVSGQPFGLYALSYALIAIFLTQAMQAVYRDHPLTHFICVLFGGFLTAVVLIVHGWIHSSFAVDASTLFAGALYSAILAPFLLWPMQKSRGLFGFQSTRRRIRPF